MVQRKRQIPLDGPCKPQSLAEINRRAAAEGLYASCTRVTRNRCESTFSRLLKPASGGAGGRTASPAAKPFRAVRRRLAARSSLDGRAKCVRAVTECALRVASRYRQNPATPPENLLRSSAGQPPRERQSQ
jgi:hypothetical protein